MNAAKSNVYGQHKDADSPGSDVEPHTVHRCEAIRPSGKVCNYYVGTLWVEEVGQWRCRWHRPTRKYIERAARIKEIADRLASGESTVEEVAQYEAEANRWDLEDRRKWRPRRRHLEEH